jgi:hypothetical protein
VIFKENWMPEVLPVLPPPLRAGVEEFEKWFTQS